MKIAHFLAACSLVAVAGLATTTADARPHGRPGMHHPHCTTTWVHHHKVRRCR